MSRLFSRRLTGRRPSIPGAPRKHVGAKSDQDYWREPHTGKRVGVRYPEQPGHGRGPRTGGRVLEGECEPAQGTRAHRHPLRPARTTWLGAGSGGELKALIKRGLENTSATVVCVGYKTAGRKYINYEIDQSIARGNGVLAVQTHHLEDNDETKDPAGAIPPKIEANGYKAYRSVDHESDGPGLRLGRIPPSFPAGESIRWPCTTWGGRRGVAPLLYLTALGLAAAG